MLGLQIPNKRMWREFDWVLLALMFALVAFGFLTLYGSTYRVAADAHFAQQQIKWILLGTVGLFALLFVDSSVFEKGAPLFYVLAVGLLAFVLTRQEIKGATSWIRLGPFRLQPSEPSKIVIVLIVARVLSKRTPLRDGNFLPGIMWVGALVGLPLALVAMQPDLGTAAVYCCVIVAMLWVARAQRGLIVAIVLWGALFGIAAFPHLKEYQKQRILVFLNPDRDPTGKGYQIIQARLAHGSGMFWGKGLGEGTQTGLGWLPFYYNDFIFSSLGEQFGFAGSVAAIALFLALIYRAYTRARRAHDLFGAYAIVGLTTILATHVALNLGMSLGLLPVTGLPLPFFSQGGSFMVTSFLIVGLVLNLRMRRFLY